MLTRRRATHSDTATLTPATSRRRILTLLVLLLGCGNAELAAPVPEPRLVLGTGESEFAPIEGEPRASLVAGAQGGFHVWAAFLVYGFDSTDLELLLTTSVEGDPDSEDTRYVIADIEEMRRSDNCQ